MIKTAFYWITFVLKNVQFEISDEGFSRSVPRIACIIFHIVEDLRRCTQDVQNTFTVDYDLVVVFIIIERLNLLYDNCTVFIQRKWVKCYAQVWIPVDCRANNGSCCLFTKPNSRCSVAHRSKLPFLCWCCCMKNIQMSWSGLSNWFYVKWDPPAFR